MLVVEVALHPFVGEVEDERFLLATKQRPVLIGIIARRGSNRLASTRGLADRAWTRDFSLPGVLI